MNDPYDDDPSFSGIVVDADRGSWPFRLIHGESLVASAAWAVGEAGVELADASLAWEVLVDRDEPLLLHDPLCPMAPPAFLRSCADLAESDDVVVIGVRPVTDTVKQTSAVPDGGPALLGATVDRDALVAICSPVVLPASIVAELDGLPSTDFVALVGELRSRWADRVRFVDAPPEARRVADEADIALLEALTTR